MVYVLYFENGEDKLALQAIEFDSYTEYIQWKHDMGERIMLHKVKETQKVS